MISCSFDCHNKAFRKDKVFHEDKSTKQYLIKICLALNDSLSFLSKDEKVKLFEKILFDEKQR